MFQIPYSETTIIHIINSPNSQMLINTKRQKRVHRAAFASNPHACISAAMMTDVSRQRFQFGLSAAAHDQQPRGRSSETSN